ncbi:5255_t:CDS:1 [Paraglomus brasilianum]|uniref:Protein-S-isoprenylcysteine O-methyltransferase n=1 Tax=Paraglomus brasilianum TaxID=144538 RepID=A0A9N9AXC3_9GLOM|nr:5255_t:CDS:1 [Paraglomus brasilianum]
MITKIIALIIVTILASFATTPPISQASSSDIKKREGIYQYAFITYGPAFVPICLTLNTLIYAWIMISPDPYPFNGIDKLSEWTLVDIVSFALILLGGLLRIWCYRTLGRFFTFAVVIQHDHKLIKDPPYSLVRHPSYTAAIMVTAGLFGFYYPLGEAIFGEYGQTITVFVIATTSIMTVYFFAKRVQYEEREMAMKFKDEWEEYARSRYRFIPYMI